MNRDIVRTGIWGLDKIFLGGIRYPNSALIQGPPGSGKTTLGIQIIRNGIEFGHNGIILSFEQLEEQLFRDALNYGWDLKKFIDQNKLAIFFLSTEDFTHTFTQKESKAIGIIAEQVTNIGAKRILIDSVNHLWHRPLTKITPRKLLFNFMNALKALELSAFVTSEVASSSPKGSIAMEEYILDTVIKLSVDHGLYSKSPGRFIEISKSRGQNFLEGKHPLRFSSDVGIKIFPCIMPEPYTPKRKSKTRFLQRSSGIQGLDDMLHGGYISGTLNLIAGPTGTFKSAIGAHFLKKSIDNNIPSLLISFQEEPPQYLQAMQKIGINLANAQRDGKLIIRHNVPINICLLESYYEIEKLIKDKGIRHIVVDNLNDFRKSLPNMDAEKYFITLFTSMFRKNAVTALLIEQLAETTDITAVTNIKYASLVDTIIYVGFVEIDSRLAKVISVFKMRGEFTENQLREIIPTKKGIVVTDKFISLAGSLHATETEHKHDIIKDVYQPIKQLERLTTSSKSLSNKQMRTLISKFEKQITNLSKNADKHFNLTPQKK